MLMSLDDAVYLLYKHTHICPICVMVMRAGLCVGEHVCKHMTATHAHTVPS